MGLVMFFAVRNDAPTSDEPPHILSGYVALKYGHDYIDIEHPLLIKAAGAGILLPKGLKVDLDDPNYNSQKKDLDIGKLFKASRNFLNYSENDPEQILLWTRAIMILFTLLFGIVFWLLAKYLFGEIVALLAVFLYSTEPNILAHGSLFNTDIGAAGFISLTILALVFYNRKQSLNRLIFIVLALTAAILTKFSTFYLVPLIVLFILIINFKKLKQGFLHLVFLLVSSFAIICIFYGLIGFRDKGLSAFFPTTYFKGLKLVFDSVSEDKRFSFLLGKNYYGSKPEYFPVLLTAKTQILTLIGFFMSLIFLFLRKISLNSKELLIILATTASYFLLAIFSTFNIGVRHILPIYPVLIIFSSAGLVVLIKTLIKKFQLRAFLAILFSVFVIFSFRFWSLASTYPHFLSYYNIIFGGTDNGWKIANDSNYDWGQDVKRLAEFVRSNNIKSLAFDNFTGLYAAKDYYHLPVWQFSPSQRNYKGYVALSTSVITYYQNQEQNYSWIINKYKPVFRAGKSIFVYNIN